MLEAIFLCQTVQSAKFICQLPEFLVCFPSMKWSNSLNESAAAAHLRKFWADGNNSNEEMEIWNYVGVNVFKV